MKVGIEARQESKHAQPKQTPEVMNEHLAADLLGLSVQTLRNWRHLRKGPAYIKLSRRVLYRRCDLDECLDRHRVNPEG